MNKRPIESTLPSEIMEKAREYAKTIEHSYADTREELEEDVAEAWAKGFIFCMQGKVEAIYKDKEETIQKLTDEVKTWKKASELNSYKAHKLGERANQLLKDKGNLIDENKELKKQIEKMKECANCPVWLLNQSERNCKDCKYKEALILLRR
jgi:hypothetical protein